MGSAYTIRPLDSLMARSASARVSPRRTALEDGLRRQLRSSRRCTCRSLYPKPARKPIANPQAMGKHLFSIAHEGWTPQQEPYYISEKLWEAIATIIVICKYFSVNSNVVIKFNALASFTLFTWVQTHRHIVPGPSPCISARAWSFTSKGPS